MDRHFFMFPLLDGVRNEASFFVSVRNVVVGCLKLI